MGVVDIQTWADNIELVRYPQTDSEISVLQTNTTATSDLLVQKSQEFTDRLDANFVSIVVAKAAADAADIIATDAQSRVYTAELGAKTYTDAEIQKLKDFLVGHTGEISANIEENLNTSFDTKFTAAIPNIEAVSANTLAEITAIKDAAETGVIDSAAILDLLLSTTLPGIDTQLGVTTAATTQTANVLAALTNGMSQATIIGAVDEARAEAEAALAPMATSVLRIPRTLWGRNMETVHTGLVKTTLNTYGTFVTDDADFGEAFEFEQGTNTNIGPSFPFDYDPDRVYKVTVQLKAIHDGSGTGSRTRIGATVTKGIVPVVVNEEAAFSPEYIEVVDGVQKHSIYISGNLVKLNGYDISPVNYIHLENSETANKIYIHVRQNAEDSSTGQISVGSIYLTDVTEVLDAIIPVLEELEAARSGAVPATPVNLALSTTTLSDGRSRVQATWDANTELDLAYYDILVSENGGADISITTTVNNHYWDALAGSTLTVSVRAVTTGGRQSPYTATAQINAAADTVAPPAVTGVVVRSGFNSVWIEWVRNSAADLSHYEVYQSDATTTPASSAVPTHTVQATSMFIGDVADGSTHNFWVRAVDRSGNLSGWGTRVAVTLTNILPALAIAGKITNTQISDDAVRTPQIQAQAVTSSKVTTGELLTLSAQIKNAIINNAHIANLSAAKLTAGTALASTLTVSGTQLGLVQSRSADPAARINANTVKVDPGRILISGSTTLQDWRKGDDTTNIDGGKLSAATVTANKLTVGNRNIVTTGFDFEHNSPSADMVSWLAGTITYIDDTGATASFAISANAAGVLWTSGTIYIYWTKNTTTLGTTTDASVAFDSNNLVLASYKGDLKLVAEFGKTIIDGSSLKTGTVEAERLILDGGTVEAGPAGVLRIKELGVDTSQIAMGAVTVPGLVTGTPLISSNLEATELLKGWRYQIISTGNTDFTNFGSTNSNVGTEFMATRAGTGTDGTGRCMRTWDRAAKAGIETNHTATAIINWNFKQGYAQGIGPKWGIRVRVQKPYDYSGNLEVINSGSFTARQLSIYNVYWSVLNRNPDTDGFLYWTTGGGSAVSIESVINTFYLATEFTDTISTTNSRMGMEAWNDYPSGSLALSIGSAGEITTDVIHLEWIGESTLDQKHVTATGTLIYLGVKR